MGRVGSVMCVCTVYTHIHVFVCVCVCVTFYKTQGFSKFRKIKISTVLPLLYFMAGFLASSFMCILYKIGDKSLEEEEAGRSPEIPFQKLEPWKVSTIKEYRWLEFEGFKPPNLESAGGPHLRFETSSVSRARENSTIKKPIKLGVGWGVLCWVGLYLCRACTLYRLLKPAQCLSLWIFAFDVALWNCTVLPG